MPSAGRKSVRRPLSARARLPRAAPKRRIYLRAARPPLVARRPSTHSRDAAGSDSAPPVRPSVCQSGVAGSELSPPHDSCGADATPLPLHSNAQPNPKTDLMRNCAAASPTQSLRARPKCSLKHPNLCATDRSHSRSRTGAVLFAAPAQRYERWHTKTRPSQMWAVSAAVGANAALRPSFVSSFSSSVCVCVSSQRLLHVNLLAASAASRPPPAARKEAHSHTIAARRLRGGFIVV